MLMLPASSQTLLNDSTCCVPCIALKKALIVKTEKDYLKNQLGVARDSIVVLDKIVYNQDSIIKIKDMEKGAEKDKKMAALKQFIKKPELVKAFKERDVKIDTGGLVG